MPSDEDENFRLLRPPYLSHTSQFPHVRRLGIIHVIIFLSWCGFVSHDLALIKIDSFTYRPKGDLNAFKYMLVPILVHKFEATLGRYLA